MPAPRAILFDLDGTLVDASAAIADGVLELAAELGLAVPERAWAVARVGFSPHETWAALGARDPADCVARFRARYLPSLPQRTRILDGVPDTLARLAAAGTTLALATTRSTDSATATLEHAGLKHLFACIAGGDLVARHKPDPEVIRFVLQRLGLRAGQALMVGDTDADVLAAHAAGLPCWGVLTGTHDERRLREAGADLILSGLADLPAALERLP